MECYYHPSIESTDNCAICHKSICKECGLEIAGKVYCKDCLEKIVGLNLAENTQQKAPQQEPVRLERQAPPQQEPPRPEPAEVQFSNTQKIADDSPYNIKSNIQYEGGVQSGYDETYQPRESLHQSIENIQTPQKPVEDVRREYIQEDDFMTEVLREPAQQARNEYDSVQARPQAPPADDYIYPDHSYQPPETSARASVEDKYERYLDDLYFDEEEVPLNEQLARDEAKFGSLTRHEYQPRNAYEQKQAADDDLDRRIREELARREGKGHSRRNRMHNIEYAEEKEPYSAVDIILTVILVIVIIIVVFYILYIFRLSATYPTFVDAIMGLSNPQVFFSALF